MADAQVDRAGARHGTGMMRAAPGRKGGSGLLSGRLPVAAQHGDLGGAIDLRVAPLLVLVPVLGLREAGKGSRAEVAREADAALVA